MSFDQAFGGVPEAVAEAPGRVNLLGEHTDYSEGYVLPTAIPQKTRVSIRRSKNGRFNVYSADLDRTAEFTMGSPPVEQFASYVYGCVRELNRHGVSIPPLDIYVESDVPIGVGLSSSAALEIATLRALRQLFSLELDDVTLAQYAQRAEIEYAGVNCGILDQMASSLLDRRSMLFLDTRTLERRLLPLPDGAEVLVIDSGVSRSLASSKYNERRAECEEAASKLGVRTLRDVADIAAVETLPDPWRRRARHVVTENARVLQAINKVSPEQFGRLMNESHASLRDDYEVSIPQLDDLAALMQQETTVYGAKLTGAGFGGACVALCEAHSAHSTGHHIVERYSSAAYAGRVLVPLLS